MFFKNKFSSQTELLDTVAVALINDIIEDLKRILSSDVSDYVFNNNVDNSIFTYFERCIYINNDSSNKTFITINQEPVGSLKKYIISNRSLESFNVPSIPISEHKAFRKALYPYVKKNKHLMSDFMYSSYDIDKDDFTVYIDKCDYMPDDSLELFPAIYVVIDLSYKI